MTRCSAKSIVLPILERWNYAFLWKVSYSTIGGCGHKWFRKEINARAWAEWLAGATVVPCWFPGNEHPTCSDDYPPDVGFIPL